MPRKTEVPVVVDNEFKEVEIENVVMGKEGYEEKPPLEDVVVEPENIGGGELRVEEWETRPEDSVCRHVNKQHYNTKGRLEDLFCDLPRGHAGDHHAMYLRNVADHVYNNKGVVVEERYNPVEENGYWGNGAGVPTKGIKAPPEAPQFSQFQRDLVAAILREKPDMSAEDAYAKAKASPVWTAGNV